jgi:single-stranded-DNA-specific exonuclease
MGQVPHVIVLHQPHWPSGVLGLIASRLMESYGRPTIIMKQKEKELVASCRSLNGFDITQFLRDHALELFTTMGGHAEAGGFTLPIEHLAEFKKRVSEFAPRYIDPKAFLSTLAIDCTIEGNQLSLPLKKQLDQLEPFGQGNPEPVLLLQSVTVVDSRLVGQKQNHLQLDLDAQGQPLKAIAFNFGEHASKIRSAQRYDVVFRLSVNEWRHKKTLQLMVVDMAKG